MRQNAFGGRASHGPAGGASALPRPLAAIRGVPTSKGEEREGMGKGKEGDGKREREDGKGRRGRARHVCIPINEKLPLHRCPLTRGSAPGPRWGLRSLSPTIQKKSHVENHKNRDISATV